MELPIRLFLSYLDDRLRTTLCIYIYIYIYMCVCVCVCVCVYVCVRIINNN